MDILIPGDADTIGQTVGHWPVLTEDNYLSVLPAYTHALAEKLVNGDADVAAAINAAQAAQEAAAAIGATTHASLASNITISTARATLFTLTLGVGSPAEKWAIDTHLDWSPATSAAVTVVQLAIDGTDQPAQLVGAAPAGARLPLHRRYTLTGLTTGPNTLTLSARTLAATAIAHAQHTTMTAERIR